MKMIETNRFHISENFIEVCFPFANLSAVSDGVKQVREQVESLIQVMNKEHLVAELLTLLDLKGRRNFIEKYLQPAIEADLVEYTQPDSPKSPKQKYQLTEKGLQLKEILINKTN